MSVQVSYRKQFLFGIILLAIFLLIIESSVRISEYKEPNCAFILKDALDDLDLSLKKSICNDLNNLGYEDPNIIRHVPNQHFSTLNINSHGFRGPEIDIEKPVNTTRIFLVGGSTAAGLGSASDEVTITGFLQKHFDSIDGNVEVINAGIGQSYSLKEEWYVKNYLIKFDPDIIIIYSGGNDARYRATEPEITEQAFLKQFMLKLQYNYRTFNVILTTIYPDLSEDRAWAKRDWTKLDNDQVVDLWKDRIRNICTFGNEHNFKTVMAVQPILASSKKTYSPDEQLAYEKQLIGHEGNKPKIILQKMVDSLDELETSCTKTIDMRSYFDNYSNPIFYDDIHINEFGQSMVAKKLFETTLPLLPRT